MKALEMEAQKGRMLRRRIETKLKETRLEIRALEMEARALTAEMAIHRMKATTQRDNRS